MEKEFYVYEVRLKGELVYVGKGTGRRFNHVLSGRSHNRHINETYFKSTLLGEPPLEVDIIKWFDCSDEALAYESDLINTHKPDFNIRGNGSVKPPSKKKAVISRVKNPNPPTGRNPLWPKDHYNVPDDYDCFKVYFNGCYEDYLSKSVAENPHPLKWYVYGKLISDGWIHYHDMLSDYYKELTEDYEDKRKNNKGRPRKSFRDLLDMTDRQRHAFYKWQRKEVGHKLSIENPEHIEMVKDWLESKK